MAARTSLRGRWQQLDSGGVMTQPAPNRRQNRQYTPDVNQQIAKLTEQISLLTGQVQTLAAMQADWNKRIERLENQQMNERENTIARGWQAGQNWIGYVVVAALAFLVSYLTGR
jgi:chromosome segregation ATPase